MELEIVGRHALLFDDDATAEVVNSGGSLVPWAAVGATDLLLDRHDVRHLLDRVPPRPRRSYSAALLSAPSPDGVSEAELDRERFLDLSTDDGGDGGDGTRDAHPSGDEECTRQVGYNAVAFSYGSTADSNDPNSSSSYYRPSFYVPESLLNKLVNDWSRDEVSTSDAHCFLAMYLAVRSRQPPSEKVHQIIARTALFVSQHGGQSEIVLRVKQGSNPTFGFLMPDHHLHSYFRYLVDHPQLLKDGVDAEDTDKDHKAVNTETEHAPSGGALSLLGTAYDSGDEEEDTVPINPKNGTSTVQVHGTPASDNDKLREDQTVAAETVGKTILMKKNPSLTGNRFVTSQRESVEDIAVKSHDINSGLTEAKEMILEPPSFMKRTMEKIVEFILRNGKEFEEKLIEQDRTTGRFPFLLSSNLYHSYYLKMLQETQESKSCGRSPEYKDRTISAQRKDRSPSERKERKSSSHRKDIDHGKERSRSMERPRSMERQTTGINARAPDRSSAEPSEKHLHEQRGKSTFQVVVGVRKEPPRKVTADEAAAIVMAATRGLSNADDSRNTLKEVKDSVPTLVSNDRSSSFGSFSSLQGRDEPSKHTSNSEADTSLTSSGPLKKEGTGIIDDDWIANTIAKAAAVAASKEADSSEATMTKEQKLKAERLRRAKMFAAIIKSGGSKMNDLDTVADPSNEPEKSPHSDDMNAPTPDLSPSAKEREGSSVPFEREGSVVAKEEKETDDEQNRVRKYRKKHYPESDEDKNDLEESYKPSRKRHRSEHSRGHSKDVHKHKSRSKDGESRHRRRQHSSSEDEHEHRSSKSRHRHKDRDHHDEDDYRSRRHRRDHRSSSKRNYEDDRDQIEEAVGRSESSPRTSGPKIELEKPRSDTAQSSGTTEVSSELRAKIRAMLLETL